MLNVSVTELHEMSTRSDARVSELKSKIHNFDLEIEQLTKERGGFYKMLSGEEKKIVAIREALILNKGIPNDVCQLRKKLLLKMHKVRSEDITIAQQKCLHSEIVQLTAELQKKCPHSFVFHKVGYIGSPSEDYENGYPSERYCVVCGLEEKAIDYLQNGILNKIGSIFETLKDAEDRIVHREPYSPHPQCLSKINIWTPLVVILKPFEDSVARTLNE